MKITGRKSLDVKVNPQTGSIIFSKSCADRIGLIEGKRVCFGFFEETDKNRVPDSIAIGVSNDDEVGFGYICSNGKQIKSNITVERIIAALGCGNDNCFALYLNENKSAIPFKSAVYEGNVDYTLYLFTKDFQFSSYVSKSESGNDE
jgi:hypothetical protein